MNNLIALVQFLVVITACGVHGAENTRILPKDLIYRGAFRLPDVAGECDWTYGGHAMTYYPGGDTANSDNYPGSLFATGNDAVCQHVSEISIPSPLISQTKNVTDLPLATTLQAFSDIRSGLFGAHDNLVLPRVGMEYLSAKGSQSTGKIHFSWGQHIQDFEVSHGWCDVNLSIPKTAGPWYFGSWTNYVTNDYIFEISPTWANSVVSGLFLASGRAREGPWAGLGPALFAYAPWQDGNPPAKNSTLTHMIPLLLYGTQQVGTPEIVTTPGREVLGYSDADHWLAGAWLNAGDKSAVIFVGTKAVGESWYGFADGTVWPYECNQPGEPVCPEVPEFPYNDRGFWADSYSAQIMFYDPDDLADVARGIKESWEPQPYAFFEIDNYLFDPYSASKLESFLTRYKRDLVISAAYDKSRNFLYIVERQVEDEKGIIHVWQIRNILPPPEGGDEAIVGPTFLLLDD